MRKIGPNVDGDYSLCHKEEGTIDYLLKDCHLENCMVEQ